MKLLASLRSTRGAISLVLAVLAALVLIGINEAGYSESSDALDRIEQYTRTRNAVNTLLQHVLDAETGSRGYLLTGDPRYLEPYDTAVAEIGQQADLLRAAYAPNSPEAGTLNALTLNVQRKLAEMDLSVRMRKQGNEEAWKSVLLTDVGKEHMDAIRAQAGRLIESASASMALAQDQVERSLRFSRAGIAIVAVAALVAFALYLRQTTRLKLAGEQQQAALQQERDLWRRRCASARPRSPSSPRTCSRCARKSAATSRANCTTNSAPCSPPPSSMWHG